jgi:hypothetical protein
VPSFGSFLLTIVALPAAVSVWLAAGGEGGDVLAFRILPVGSLVPGPTQPVLPEKKGIILRVFAVKEAHTAPPPHPFSSK